MKLSLKVVPGSCADEIAGWLGDSLKIRVRAPAESGKANAAVTEILAATLGLHKRAVSIYSGTSSARKIVEIDDLTEAEIRARLAEKFG
jgi:uncharacterized protein (TIGR00251 family)